MTEEMSTGDIRERLAVLETLLRESARERAARDERVDRERKADADVVRQALSSAAEHVRDALNRSDVKSEKALAAIDTRLEKVEDEFATIRIGWILLVKAGSIGGAIMTTIIGAAVWIAIKIGWIPARY